jgi:trigger factor
VNISVENLTTVDKKIIVEADGSDLQPKIDKALKDYRKKMSFPGFRPGMAPMGLVKKRIGKEVEAEQLENFVQEVFREKSAPEHKPVGEPEISKMDYTDGKLVVEFQIGVSPEFETVDLKSINIEKLVHDVTEEDVEKEYNHRIRRFSEWSETEDAATAESRVTIDAWLLDKEGNRTDDHDHDVVIYMDSEKDKEYADALNGKKADDETVVTFKEEDDDETRFQVVVKKVETQVEPELNEEFFKKMSQDAASSEEEYRTLLKNQIQDYFDRISEDIFKDKLTEALIKSHDFEIPATILNLHYNSYKEQLKSKNNGELPEGFDEETFRNENRERVFSESKWLFISQNLMEKFPDIEITPEDVDAYFQVEAAKMGLPAEMLKNFYASSGDRLEELRMTIRTNKLFTKLAEEVSITELGKDEFEKKYSKKK